MQLFTFVLKSMKQFTFAVDKSNNLHVPLNFWNYFAFAVERMELFYTQIDEIIYIWINETINIYSWIHVQLN